MRTASLFSFAVLLACAAPIADAPSDDKLIGGAAPEGEWVSALGPTVALGNLCTATRVGPRHLLTAAHCVAAREGCTILARISERFATGVTLRYSNELAPSSYWRAVVARTWFAPAFESACAAGCAHGTSFGRDLAIIETTEPLDARVPMATLDLRPVAEGQEVVKAGYGCETFDVTSWQPRLKYDLTRAITEFLSSSEDPSQAFLDVAVITPGYYGDTSEASLCYGDSGGPLYRYEGAVTGVVAVHSSYRFDRSLADRLSDLVWERPRASSVDVHAQLAPHEAWLRSVLPAESFRSLER